MKVLLLDRFFGGRDGPGIYIHDLAQGLLARGHRVALAFGTRQGDYAPPGLEPFEVPGLTALWGSAAARRRLDEVVAQLEPDVANAQCLDILWFAEQVARRCPLVATFHTHAISCPNWTRLFERDQTLCQRDFGPACAWHSLRDGCGSAQPQALAGNLVRVGVARRMMRHVDAVQAVSPYMRTTLERTRLFDGDQIFDLPYPAPFFDGERAYSAPPRPPRLLFVGRLHHTKGPQLLVDAAARMSQSAELVFVGDGPDEAKLRARAGELGVTERCRFVVGREATVSRDQLSHLYLEATAVVVPSIWGDPAPLVRLEAMAHGRPLVGFDSGGVADCISDGKTGFVVKRLDVAGLAARLDELVRNPALGESMGRLALQRARELHHPELLAVQLEEIYRRLIAQRSGSGSFDGAA